MANELLGCPFCGSDELSHGWSYLGFNDEHSGIVQCHAEGCNAVMLGATEVDAITAWNTRLSTTPPERDLIVAWLRAFLEQDIDPRQREIITNAANAIERGEHLSLNKGESS